VVFPENIGPIIIVRLPTNMAISLRKIPFDEINAKYYEGKYANVDITQIIKTNIVVNTRSAFYKKNEGISTTKVRSGIVDIIVTTGNVTESPLCTWCRVEHKGKIRQFPTSVEIFNGDGKSIKNYNMYPLPFHSDRCARAYLRSGIRSPGIFDNCQCDNLLGMLHYETTGNKTLTESPWFGLREGNGGKLNSIEYDDDKHVYNYSNTVITETKLQFFRDKN
jgi:hypothetical protein